MINGGRMQEGKRQTGTSLTRRQFVQAGSLAALSIGAVSNLSVQADGAAMFRNLGAGHIGVKATQVQAMELAARHGFEGVNVHLSDLEAMTKAQRAEFVASMRAKNLRWGSSGLSVDFRKGDQEFRSSLAKLPAQAAVLAEVGATRVSTWLTPGHATLTYRQNFELHRQRLAEAGRILKDHGLRLGLEYVGPKTSRDRSRFHFIHTQVELMELIEAIGTGNVGILLDSYHWHTSHGTAEDLAKLTNELVVDVHVNDAQPGIEIDALQDLKRALPCSTGVIDLKTYMTALARMNYDGPVTIEPFDQELNAMEDDAAVAKTKAALDKTFALLA